MRLWSGSKWHCNHKYDDDHTCRTPHLTDEEIRAAFHHATNRLLSAKDEVVANGRTMMDALFDIRDLES